MGGRGFNLGCWVGKVKDHSKNKEKARWGERLNGSGDKG